MALSRGASDPDPDNIRPLKPCLLCRKHNRDQHCVAASCLEELRRKACKVLAIDESLTPVTLVLAEDGTIVDDDDYFLCLPSNTKFVALACNEKGAYNNSDGGTAWVSQESIDANETDSGAGVKWKDLARMLKEDLSNIILLSEEELELVSKADPRALAVALSGDIKKAESPTCLQQGARPAPAASAEVAFPQECLGEEDPLPEEQQSSPQTHQTRPQVAPPEARFAEEALGFC